MTNIKAIQHKDRLYYLESDLREIDKAFFGLVNNFFINNL